MDEFFSNVMVIQELDHPSIKRYLCQGCQSHSVITTNLPWKAIDHTAWEWQKHSEIGITYVSRGTCFDALAAAAAVEALAHLHGYNFTHSVLNEHGETED